LSSADHQEKRADELRAIAAALRDLPRQETANVNRLNLAGKYLAEAIARDAFPEAKWLIFRTESKRWLSGSLPFVSACEWLRANLDSLGMEFDSERGNGDLGYWAPYLADLIESTASELDASARQATDQMASQPTNWWRAINYWWQHTWYATAAVVLVIAIPAIRGLVAFANDFIQLLK